MTHIHDDLGTSRSAAEPTEAAAPPNTTTEEWTNEGGALTDGPAVPTDHTTGDAPQVPTRSTVDPDDPTTADARSAQPVVNPHELVDIDDTDLAVAAGQVDVRGFTVLDRDSEEVGAVDGLLVDTGERHVRLLALGSGGFLGLGRKTRLVPTAAVTDVDPDAQVVRIDTTRQAVAGSPAYDPDLDQAPLSWDPYYGYYGYPTWGRPTSHEATRPMV